MTSHRHVSLINIMLERLQTNTINRKKPYAENSENILTSFRFPRKYSLHNVMKIHVAYRIKIVLMHQYFALTA